MQNSDLLVTALHGIEINEPLGIGCQIAPRLLLTNSFSSVQKHFSPEFKHMIGALEYSALERSKAILYSHGTPGSLISKRPQDTLVEFLSEARAFVHSLWLIKDNAANMEMGFAQTCAGAMTGVNSNFFAVSDSTAAGLEPTITFSRDELRKAISLARDFLFPLTTENLPKSSGGPLAHLRDPKLGSHASRSRLTRAFYFLTCARASEDVGIKNVLYSTALETLFSTDAVELTHKVSHRIATFLGGSVEQRLNLFSKVKKAYTVRSKVVHGDVLAKDSKEQIATVATDIDDILRQVFIKMSSDSELFNLFQGTKENLEKYFLKCSFAGPEASSLQQQ